MTFVSRIGAAAALLLTTAPIPAAVLALLLASLSAGCGTAQEGRRPDDGPPARPVAGGVQPGMTLDEVRARLGAPLDTVRVDGRLRWVIYGTAFERAFLYVQGGTVAAVPPVLDRTGGTSHNLRANADTEENVPARGEDNNRSE